MYIHEFYPGDTLHISDPEKNTVVEVRVMGVGSRRACLGIVADEKLKFYVESKYRGEQAVKTVG